jgi:hypothetical protein
MNNETLPPLTFRQRFRRLFRRRGLVVVYNADEFAVGIPAKARLVAAEIVGAHHMLSFDTADCALDSRIQILSIKALQEPAAPPGPEVLFERKDGQS